MGSRSLKKIKGLDVRAPGGRRVGTIGDALFEGTRVVGLSIERPPLLFLLPLKDRYLALDRAGFTADEVRISDAKDAWDEGAAKRLGISWDTTVIWLGMPAKTRGGADLGRIRDAMFDPATGVLSAVGLTGGITADVALGVRDVLGRLAQGFDGGVVVFADEAAAVETSGGASVAAAKAVASAKHHGGKVAAQAATAAGSAAGAVGALGSQAARSVAKARPAYKFGKLARSLKEKVDRAISDDEEAGA